MKQLILIVLQFLYFNGLAQSYSPKNPGSTWVYVMSDESFEDFITQEKFFYNQKTYFESIRKYSWGAIDTSYFRIDEDETVYYLDPKTKEESIDVPSKPKLFFKWTSSDMVWKYEIVALNATLKTPRKYFTNCLVIKAEQISNADKNKLPTYFNYYSKSIGYVGSKVDDHLMAYLDKWEIK